MECHSLALPPLTWTQLHTLFLEKHICRTLRDLEKYVCCTLRDQTKDKFLSLEQGSMTVVVYKANFNVFSYLATQLVNTEKERICQCEKGLNTNRKLLSVHLTSVGKSFNEVSE